MTLNSKQSGEEQCTECGGTGWISYNVPVDHADFGKLFPCTNEYHADDERVKKDTLRTSRDLTYLSDMTFEAFEPEGHAQNSEQRRSLNTAYEGALRYADEPRGWLFIKGGYGVGKTHLAAAIANTRLNNGLPVTFLNAPDLLDYLRASFGADVKDTFNQRFEDLRKTELLILDDLGTQNATGWAEEKLFQILNHRYVAKLPTVITTNLQPAELDPRLSSRLADMDLVRAFPIDAPDYRRMPIEQGQSSLSNLHHYYDKKFESFEMRTGKLSASERRNLEEAVAITRSYAENPQGWLALFGPFGSGKTHLAAAIANLRTDRGYAALFVVVPDLLDHLRATYSPQSSVSYDQRFDEVRSASMLILDDLGTESATPWAREKLYQIINFRHAARLPTVITTSLSPDEFDPRIRTRVLDETLCRIVSISGPSYRGSGASTKGTAKQRRKSMTRKRR